MKARIAVAAATLLVASAVRAQVKTYPKTMVSKGPVADGEARQKARDRMCELAAKAEAEQAMKAAAEAKERLAQFAGVRTWTTERGQTLDVKFVALRADEVQFQDAAGNPYRIHITLLRIDDQKIARELAAATP